THELLKQHGAALVTDPGDVLEILETPARHSFQGSHEARYADPSRPPDSLFDGEEHPAKGAAPAPASGPKTKPLSLLTPSQQAILQALEQPRSLDDVARETGISPSSLRAEVTMLELQ